MVEACDPLSELFFTIALKVLGEETKVTKGSQITVDGQKFVHIGPAARFFARKRGFYPEDPA
jgi:hypothetical protein